MSKNKINNADSLDEELNNLNINNSLNINKKKICLNCLKVITGTFRCGQCRAAYYCNRTCQKKHWSAHKSNCEDANIDDNIYQKLYIKASNHFRQGNAAKAEKFYVKLLNILRSTIGENEKITLDVMNSLSVAYDDQFKHTEAENLYRRCYTKQVALLGERNDKTLDTMYNLSVCLLRQGKYADAGRLFNQCLAKQIAVFGENHENPIRTTSALATCLSFQGKFTEAETLSKQCLEKQKNILGEDHKETLICMQTIGDVYHRQGKFAEAEAILKECLGIYLLISSL